MVRQINITSDHHDHQDIKRIDASFLEKIAIKDIAVS